MAVPVAVAVYVFITAAILSVSYFACGRHLIYPLDDPYIEMAMAKSFALHGVWGITRYAFTSSSSSPLFTVLLAVLYKVFGVHQWVSLAISWCFGLACIPVAAKLLSADRTIALIVFVLATPLFGIGALGMENTLHLLLVLLFLLRFRDGKSLFAITGLMVLTRYESVFLLLAAGILLACRGDRKRACGIAVGTATAILAFGLYSVAHGGALLPNSVLLKSPTHGIMGAASRSLVIAPHVFTLLLALAVCLPQFWKSRDKLADLIAIVLFAGLAHLAFARVDSIFRYQAYILGPAALLAVSSLGALAGRTRWIFMALLCLAAYLIALRSVKAAVFLPLYSQAIYDQQIQTARFLSTYFPDSSVAANDIGAISYFTDIQCTDLVGLANQDIFDAKRQKRYETALLASEATYRRVQIAVVYDTWFTGDKNAIFFVGPRLPSTWTRVGRLVTPDPGNLGGNIVSFYSTQQGMIVPLRSALVAFRPTLPRADRLEIP
ncbi:MAG TPA: hypothetical protein VFW25_00105 [Silvibacterium sp.]|nr:hypothetical protein [Silvibacterium sp.]